MNISNGSANTIWTSNYAALARINRAIDFSYTVSPVDAADVQLIERTRAEALVLRAICHLKIMSYYSTDPKNDAALAGVLANRVIETTETPTQELEAVGFEWNNDVAKNIYDGLVSGNVSEIADILYEQKVLSELDKMNDSDVLKLKIAYDYPDLSPEEIEDRAEFAYEACVISRERLINTKAMQKYLKMSEDEARAELPEV